MDYDPLIISTIGGVAAFLLAQLFNLAKLIGEWWIKPRLRIEVPEGCRLLSHSMEIMSGQVDEIVYGFYIRNEGRRIADGIRFQITSIEIKERVRDGFEKMIDAALELRTFSGSNSEIESSIVTIVPGARVEVEVARWREDSLVVLPSVAGLSEYYEEMCLSVSEYKFHVVAFDERGDYVSQTLHVVPER